MSYSNGFPIAVPTKPKQADRDNVGVALGQINKCSDISVILRIESTMSAMPRLYGFFQLRFVEHISEWFIGPIMCIALASGRWYCHITPQRSNVCWQP